MSDEHPAGNTDAGDSLETSSSAAFPPAFDERLLHQAGDVLENLRSQLAELDRREQHVAAQTTALENERRRLRLSSQEFDDRMKQQEAAMLQQQAALEARLAEVESSEQQLAEQQSVLQQQRERLRQEVVAELDHDRSELEQQRDQFQKQVAEYQAQWNDGVAGIESALAEERETRRRALEAELDQLAETIEAEQSHWDEQQRLRQEQFDAETSHQQEQLAQLRSEWELVREEQLAEITRREQTLERKQVDLEKRTRFHETHLSQLRQTLEQQQADLDRRHQVTRSEQTKVAADLDRRRRQMFRYRERLAQREESLDRQHALLHEARESLELHRGEETARSLQQRKAWDEERQALRADIRRQQDMLTLHAKNLEARRTRLDSLRDDLEETHRQTLELRMVVEQVWAQLSQTFGEETTRRRVEQARSDLLSGYESSRQSLLEQQAAIHEAETRLEDQRSRFRHERQQFAQWMSDREQQLLEREQSLQQEIEAAAQNEAHWRSTRDRWTLEKIEAESVIRQLLQELDADLLDPPTCSAPEQEPATSTGTISDESTPGSKPLAAA